MVPISTTGHSTSPPTSCSSPSSSLRVSPASLASFSAPARISSRRSAAIQHHLGGAQLGLVVGEVLDLDGGGRQEAVAEGRASRRYGAVGQRHDLAVEQGEDGMQRPHPAGRVGAPAHGLRPRQGGNGVAQQLRQHLGGRRALLLDHHDVVVALLGIGAGLAGVQAVEPVGIEEALDGLVGRTDARPLALLADVGLGHRQAVDEKRQTTRRHQGLGRRELQPRVLEPGGDQAFQVLGGTRLHAGRDFLGEQFKQQFSHRSALRPAALDPGFAAALGQGADAADISGTFGNADHAAGIEKVEQMAGLDALVIGRQGKLLFQ